MFHRSLRLLSLLFVCALTPALLAQANLSLDIFAGFPRLAPGSAFAIDAYYSNSGPNAATGVKLTIAIPPGFQYEGYKAPSPFTCTEPPKDGQGDLVCTASSLGANLASYVEADIRVDPAAVPGTVITMSATLTSSNAIKPSQTISQSTTVLQPTNLRIAMSAPASATQGDTFPITVTVTNDGPIAAEFVDVEFTRQALVSWGPIIAAAGWTCGLSCRINSFPPGTATFTMSATTSASTILTSVREQASVYSASDGDYSDNVATATTTIVPLPHADLKLSVVADKTTVIKGQLVTNTYTVTNNGPDSARYVELVISVPGSLSSVTSTFASCTQTAQVRCDATSLAAGGVLTATVSFTPDQIGTFNSVASLQWPINSGTVGFATQYTSLEVIPDPAQPADLSATVTMPPTVVYKDGLAVAAGQFTVTNAGPWAAQNVTVDFNAGSQATLPGFTCGWKDAGYRCTAASMAPGSVTGTLTATWPAAPNGTLETTTVTATSASRDPDTTNNSASAKTTVIWQSDLTLQQLTMPSPVLAGALVIMDAHYFNAGPSPATDVKITITVPPGAAYDSYSAHFNTFKCTEPPKGGQGDLVCTASALDSGASDAIEMTVRVDPAVKPGTVITFPATLTCPTALKPSQSITGSTTVAAPANLRVTLSSAPTVVPGDSYLNTVTVTNAGPGNALNVRLALTAGSYFDITAPAGWGCAPGVNIATCSAASFPPGTATFTFMARTLVNFTSGTITQTATVTTVADPDDSDNVATSTTTIASGALTPVSLQFTASPDSVATGGTLTYTARIANTGRVDAKNIELYLSFPGIVQTTTCGSVAQTHCSFPTIAAGATQTVTATTRIYAAPGTSVIADAILIGANFLHDIPTTSVTTMVSNAPPITTKATVVPTIETDKTTAVTGDPVTQTFTVTNQGPDAANGVTLQIDLPNGVGFTHLSTTFPSCSGSAPIQCTMTQLVTGASLTATVSFNAPSQTGTFASTGTVSWANSGVDPGTAAAVTDLHVTETPAPPARRRAARH